MKFTVDQAGFKNLVAMAAELNETIPFKIEEDKLVIRMFDIGHTRGLVANFAIDNMVDFESIRLGLTSETMIKKLNAAHAGAIKCRTEVGKFIIRQRTTIAEINLTQEHRLFYIDDITLEEEGIWMPDKPISGLTVFAKMPNASALKEICSAIDTEYFVLSTTKNGLMIEAGGMGEGHESEFSLEMPVSIKGEMCKVKYHTESVQSVVKHLSAETNASIKFGTDRPLVVSSMGEKNDVELMFAPTIG